MSPADPEDHCQGWVSASETGNPAGLCPATDPSTNVSKGNITESAHPDNVFSTHVQLAWAWSLCIGLRDACMPLCSCVPWDMLHIGDVQSLMVIRDTPVQ